MIHAHFTYFDAAVIGIMALSCMFAFFRGFVKEILSLGAWVGAGLITIYYFPDLAHRLQPHFKSPVVAAGIATLGLYVVSLILFSMLNMFILRFVKEGGDVGFLDNMLGLFFGALRGAFMVSLAYFLMTMGMSQDEYPPWLKDARTRPYVEQGALLLAQAAPQYLREISSLNDKLQGKRHGSPLFSKHKEENGNTAAEPQPDNASGNGTTKMDELIDKLHGGAR